MSRSSITPFWARSASSEVCCVWTTMPSVTGMVHDAWGLGNARRLPSGPAGLATSTRHWRHAPAGSSAGWSQKRGISMPTCSAARMMSVPFSTCVSMPSIVTVTRSVFTGVLSAVAVMRGPPRLQDRVEVWSKRRRGLGVVERATGPR